VCCTSKFLYAFENDKVLLTHTPPWTVVPFTIFYNEGSKIGLKFSEITDKVFFVKDQLLNLE